MSKKLKEMDSKNQDLYDFLVSSELAHYYTDFTTRLKVTTIGQIKYVDMEDLRDIGMTKPEQRRLKKLYQKEHPKGTFGKLRKSILGKEKSNSRASLSMPLSVYETTKFGRHIIPAEALSIHKEIGKGEFGIVQQGVWTNEEGERIQVAIKCLSKDKLLAGQADFLKEATIMHSLDHENLVRLYGVVLDVENSLMLVTELAPLRSLSECLKEPSLRSYFPVIQLCDFCTQIASGMKYLHSKNVIHRDLATRNILVFSKDVVKISDFGLSRALGVGKDYYQTNFNVNLKLPLAWCAPESINYLKFTSSSDIWGFGVTCWETFTYGFQPWAALTGSQILQAIDSPNYQRLEKPDCCPTQYYEIMLRCWEHDPTKRPSFFELCEELPKARPMQMKALTDFPTSKPEYLSYKENDVITVLDMRSSQEGWWKGVVGSGRTGIFNTDNTMAYDPSAPSNQQHQLAQQKMLQQQQQQQQTQSSSRFKIYKKAEKPKSPQKHSKKGKHTISRDMISQPQGDVQHLAHIGIEAKDTFGDITFLQDKYHLLPKTVQEKLDQMDKSKPSPFRRTLTLPVGKEMKSRTPDLIDVPMRSPQGESMSSLQDSSRSSRSLSPKKIPLVLPKGGQTQIRLGELPPKKDETRRGGSPSKTSLSSEQNGSDRKDRTQGSSDFDDVNAVPDRRKEDAEVSAITSVIFDDDLTPPTTPCPDSPTDSLNLHFDLGPSLLDDVLSAWDNSKSTLESQFSPPSSESPPKSESSFSIDSPPKRGSSKKVLERQSSSTSPSSETFVKPLVNPIKKPKRSFRKDHPQKQYVMNVTDSPVSSPEVEAVPLPGSETSVIGRGDPFELTTDSHGVGSRDVFKTDASEVRPSFRKRDSDTESTDYLQLTESTSAIPEEDSKGELWKQQLKSSSVEQSDDERLEEKPVFLQRSMSKREVITQEGVQAYEQLVGSKKSIKRTPLKIPSRPQQSNGTESPSRTPKNSPIKTPISPPNRTTVTSPSTAPALPPSWTSARTEERTPVASPDQTPVASPVASPIKVQSKVTLESQSSISFSSSSPIKSISDSSLSRSTSSPVKTEADLQYADLLHDTLGEDTIDLANPESFTGSENKQQSSNTTNVTFSSQAPSQVYTEVQVVPVRPTCEDEDEVTGDFDRSDEARSSARDIIKRFEQRAQPTSVKIDDPLPTKRGVKNLKDLFTMDTKETSKPRDKSPPSSPETDKLPPLPARKQSSEDDSRPDSDIGLSPATLKNLTQSTRRTRRPVGERKIKRRSMDGAESAVVSEVLKAHAEKEEKQEDGNKDEERQKQERQISLDRQKSTEEVMKSRPLPELPEPEENNTPVVEHDYEMIETPAVPPRIPLNPQWPSKKRRSRKSSKSLGGTASPTKSSSSTSSLQQSESEPGTPDTPQGTPMSPYMNSANGEWDARTKFLLQKHASLDIYSDGDLVRSSPEEIRRHLNKERAIDKQEKSLLKTASLDRNTVLTRSHTNPTLSAMDTKEDFRKLSLTGNGNNNTKIVKDSPPQRSKSYEDVLEDILDGSQLPQAESLTDVLKRTYRTQENTEMSPTQSDASSVASAGSLEKVASVESADKSASLDTLQITEPDEGYLDMTGKHSSVALADMEWTENCQEVQEVRKALQDKISVPDIVTALKCNNWDVETTVQDIKIQHLQNKQLGDERRCRHTLIRYNWDLDKALSYLINNTYRQSEL